MRVRLLPILATLALCLGPFAEPCFAQSRDQPERLDIVVALDNSGSMRKNDPDALMRSAVETFAGHLEPNAQLGIVVFDQTARVALGLSSARDPAFSTKIGETLKTVDYTGKWTDIPGGIEQAIYELREHGRADARHVIVFFTDGMVETGSPAKDVDRSRWLQEGLALEAKQRGIRVFGIAFTQGADFQLIQSVAQRTGGEHFRVLAAADIAGVFEQIRSRASAEDVTTAPAATPTAPVPPSIAGARYASGYLPWVLGLALAIILGSAAWLFRRSGVLAPAVAASLRDVGGHSGREMTPLHKTTVRIGRDPKLNDIAIPQDTMSSQHAVIEFRQGTFYLRDLRSSNGSFVNGKKISSPDSIQEAALKHGDAIRFDAYEFEFIVDKLAGVPQTQLSPGAFASPGGTRLRAEPLPGTPAAVFAAEVSPLAGEPPIARTVVRTGNCQTHPSWKATGMCPKCKQEKCGTCLPVLDGVAVCTQCAVLT